MKFFNARRVSYHTNPRIIHEVIYTPYVYEPAQLSDSRHVHFQPSKPSATQETPTADLLGVPELVQDVSSMSEGETEEHIVRPERDETNLAKGKKRKSKFDETPTEAEIFMFEYGTVVIWGMTEAQEKRFLSSM